MTLPRRDAIALHQLRRPAIGIRTWRFDRDGRVEPELPVAANADDALDWLFTQMARPT